MFKKNSPFLLCFKLCYDTLLKLVVVCFCVPMNLSENMYLLKTKDLYEDWTSWSLCINFFRRGIFSQKISLLIYAGFFLPLQPFPHSLAEVGFPLFLVVPAFAALKTSTEKSFKNPEDIHDLLRSLHPRSCIKNIIICKMWSWMFRLIVLMNIG